MNGRTPAGALYRIVPHCTAGLFTRCWLWELEPTGSTNKRRCGTELFFLATPRNYLLVAAAAIYRQRTYIAGPTNAAVACFRYPPPLQQRAHAAGDASPVFAFSAYRSLSFSAWTRREEYHTSILSQWRKTAASTPSHLIVRLRPMHTTPPRLARALAPLLCFENPQAVYRDERGQHRGHGQGAAC